MGLNTSWALLVHRVATYSLQTRIEGGSELDWLPDPSPPSDPGGVVFADSGFESSSSMGGIVGFVFRFAGGLVEDGDGVGRRVRGNGGIVLGIGRMSGCARGRGPCAKSKVPKANAG